MNTVIVEDQPIMREFLRKICTEELGFTVIAEAGDGREAVSEILRTKPEVVLLDLELPGIDGFTVINMIREGRVKPRILVFSSFFDTYSIYRVEKAMVHGFMDKNFSDIAGVRRGIAAVGRGEAYFSPAFTKVKQARHADKKAFDKVLSKTEITVLCMIGDLRTDTEIGERLNIADRTAQKHRFNIMGKLEIHSRSELEQYAQVNGFRESVVREPPPPGL